VQAAAFCGRSTQPRRNQLESLPLSGPALVAAGADSNAVLRPARRDRRDVDPVVFRNPGPALISATSPQAIIPSALDPAHTLSQRGLTALQESHESCRSAVRSRHLSLKILSLLGRVCAPCERNTGESRSQALQIGFAQIANRPAYHLDMNTLHIALP